MRRCSYVKAHDCWSCTVLTARAWPASVSKDLELFLSFTSGNKGLAVCLVESSKRPGQSALSGSRACWQIETRLKLPASTRASRGTVMMADAAVSRQVYRQFSQQQFDFLVTVVPYGSFCTVNTDVKYTNWLFCLNWRMFFFIYNWSGYWVSRSKWFHVCESFDKMRFWSDR
jgi:hypothetical protein